MGARIIEPDLFEAVAHIAGGNPLFVEELLRFLAQQALLVVQGGVASLRTPNPDLPGSLKLLAEVAAHQLSPAARAVIAALTACANVASPDALAAAVAPAHDRAAVQGAIGELTDAGVVRTDERGQLHLPRAHTSTELLAVDGHERLGWHFERADDATRAATLWERASDVLAQRDAHDASIVALVHALRASDSPTSATARLTRAEERLPHGSELPPDVEEALAHALSILDADARTEQAPIVGALRLRLAVVLRDRAAFEAALVLCERAAEHTSESHGAALRVSIAVAACNPELAPNASEELARAVDATDDHHLDVAEWAYLRGDFERATGLIRGLAANVTPLQKVRARRVDLSIAMALRGLTSDDPRVDELLALASALGATPEAARCFLCMGIHLRRDAKTSHRVRSQFVLQEATELGEASRERRVSSLARAELALAVRRQAALKDVLSQAERARAAGDVFTWLSLRASVAELASDDLAKAAIFRDANDTSLRGAVAHLEGR